MIRVSENFWEARFSSVEIRGTGQFVPGAFTYQFKKHESLPNLFGRLFFTSYISPISHTFRSDVLEKNLKNYIVITVAQAPMTVECLEFEIMPSGILLFKKNTIYKNQVVLTTFLVFAPGQWLSIE